MSKHKVIDKICIVATILSLVIAVLFMIKSVLGYEYFTKTLGYEEKLFTTDKVHTIDISMEDWEDFLTECINEEYWICDLTIDGEIYKNVGIRGKGNTSLSNVASMDSDRYSFKVEFDQYDDTLSYYGLDKLCLNNIIQDNTYMKDYLVYQMMNEFGVDAPLCSYVNITVNGENWGLYLAVEGIEEAFLQRNYGNDYGELYKPDSQSFGGGRGNGKDFQFGEKNSLTGNQDVKLQYIDEEISSYSNIFDNAKTDVTRVDKERLIQSLKVLNDGKDIESVVNIDEVMRYFVVHNFVCNGDSYTGSMIHNYYLYEKDGVLSMIPWDYNLAFGTFQGNDATSEVNTPIDTPVSNGSVEDRPMLSWIFSNEEYLEMYHQYFNQFLEKVDTDEIIAETFALISTYVEQDTTKFCTYEEFEQGVDTLKSFCELRKESIQGQLDGTIPSTEEGQKDKSTLVDASEISLSDMGTMQNGMGGMEMPEGMEKPENMEMPEGMEMPENMEMPEGMEMPENMEMPEGMEMPENMETSEGMEKPGNREGFAGENRMNFSEERVAEDVGIKTDYSSYILLGISLMVLIIGMIIAAKFKGKN